MINTKIMVTGSAGFIGHHLCKLLLNQGFIVLGIDGMTDYYDVTLKEHRNLIINGRDNYRFAKCLLEDAEDLHEIAMEFKPDIIVHLAAQAGVRYSIDFPETYVQANLIGTFNVLEVAKKLSVAHLLMASTSSVYGANDTMPFVENQKCDHPMSFYAATKKSNEVMAHAYSHIFNIPVTLFRFFTVYGPLGRPDMALFKFTKAIIENSPIDVYNNGDMQRDFTYVDDLVKAISLLTQSIPNTEKGQVCAEDTLSPVAPHRVVNIGNANPVRLMDFISAIEQCLGKEAKKNFLPMQQGDVAKTWADTSLLQTLTGFSPETTVDLGVSEFVQWFRSYYKC